MKNFKTICIVFLLIVSVALSVALYKTYNTTPDVQIEADKMFDEHLSKLLGSCSIIFSDSQLNSEDIDFYKPRLYHSLHSSYEMVYLTSYTNNHMNLRNALSLLIKYTDSHNEEVFNNKIIDKQLIQMITNIAGSPSSEKHALNLYDYLLEKQANDK
ncbi:hypothetical protein PV797_15000 [Clostridiaceae bacterium M8S5]|nr:hypothetical protein PV797_15000 [Clostridiaceae bacterium M8S5]